MDLIRHKKKRRKASPGIKINVNQLTYVHRIEMKTVFADS